MQKTIICYNQNEVIEGKGSKEEIKNGYNLWIDIVNPTSSEIFELEQIFGLERKAVQKFEQRTKKPQVLLFKNQKFTIFLSLKFNTIKNLETYAIYFFVGN
jgi:magnesium transporter